MKWLKWIDGRQGGDYQKFLLAILGIPCIFGLDIYIIKFSPKCYLKEHVDEVKGRHFRLNIILSGSGDFKCEKTIIQTNRIILFRPDKYKHSMQNGNSERKVLSIGLRL